VAGSIAPGWNDQVNRRVAGHEPINKKFLLLFSKRSSFLKKRTKKLLFNRR
jgi:hypothetical protein